MKLIEALRSHAKVTDRKFEGTKTQSHSPSKGVARERVLMGFLEPFLPKCYGLGTGQAFSSEGGKSNQLDIVIYDSLFSVVTRLDKTNLLFPCESVHGVIEVKSKLSGAGLKKGIQNIESLKSLEQEGAGILAPPIPPSLSPKKRKSYLGIIFALKGLTGRTVGESLAERYNDRKTLPDYVFNLERKCMISRYKQNGKNVDLNCRYGEYDGFIYCDLKDDFMPIFFLTLITMLDLMNSRNPKMTYKLLNDLAKPFQGNLIPWKTQDNFKDGG